MELSIDLAIQIFSMVIMGVAGYILSRLHIITAVESRILSKLCIYVFIPCTMINAFQQDLDITRLEGLALVSVAAVIIHALFIGLAYFFGKTPMKLTIEEQASIIYSNAGNLIIPVIYATLGTEYVFYTSGYIAVQNLLLWTHGQTIMGGKANLKKLVSNPCMISIVIGIAFFLLQIRLDGPIQSAIASCGACLGPVSMLVIGMLLGEQNLKKVFSNGRVYLTTFLRLIFLPLVCTLTLLVLGMFWHHSDVINVLTIVLLCAIGPAASTITQQAQLYANPNAAYVSAINVVTTMLCAITIPLVIFLFQYLAPMFL